MHPSEYNLIKSAYSLNELIALGVVGSRASAYRLIAEGKLRAFSDHTR